MSLNQSTCQKDLTLYKISKPKNKTFMFVLDCVMKISRSHCTKFPINNVVKNLDKFKNVFSNANKLALDNTSLVF